MYKKNVLPLTLVLLVSTFAKAEVNNLNANDYVKVGYFSSMEVLSTSKSGKEASTSMEQKRQGFANDLKKSEEAYAAKVKDLQAKGSTLSVSAKEKAQAEVLKMKRDFENKAKGYEEEFKLAASQMQERLFRDLSDAVYEFGRKEGFDVMVDVITGRVYVINPDKVNSSTSIVSIMDSKHDKNASSDKKTT